MMTNWKFHAIALSTICIAITGVYFLFSPAPPPPAVDPNTVGDRAIEVYSATWGMDCNPYIKDALEKQKAQTPLKAEGTAQTSPSQQLIIKDNALMKVSELCNAKNTCTLFPTNETLEMSVLDTCNKKLEISYRCYSYDRLWTLTIGQGETKKIDCNEAPTTPRK